MDSVEVYISPVKRISPSAIARADGHTFTLYPTEWARNGRVAFLAGAGALATFGCRVGGAGCQARDCTGADARALNVTEDGTVEPHVSYFAAAEPGETTTYRVCFADAAAPDVFYHQPKAQLVVFAP